MRFLACLLTLQHHSSQEPLLFAEYVRLRQDILMAFFPTEHACPHLLTVACLRSDQHQTVLRLTLAEEQQHSTLSQLLRRVHSGQPILFCQRSGEISAFDISDPTWTGMSTWADVQTSQGSASFRFIFATPLITALPLARESLDALPFPEPETVFARALEQWQSFSGPAFPCSAKQMVQAARCVLADYRLHTVAIPLAPFPVVGYLGWVEYSCLQPQAEAIMALAALARLTFFTGCGYEAATGFGTTRAVLRERGS